MHILNIGTKSIAAGSWDALYSRYLQEILEHGDTFVGRNGETKSLFGTSCMVDLQHGFPLTRLRKMPVTNLFREFLFDIGFSQNVDALGPARHFWDFLADEEGNLGASAYNRQWQKQLIFYISKGVELNTFGFLLERTKIILFFFM